MERRVVLLGEVWLVILASLSLTACRAQFDEDLRRSPESPVFTLTHLDTSSTTTPATETSTQVYTEPTIPLGTPSPQDMLGRPDSTQQNTVDPSIEPTSFLLCPPLDYETISSLWEIVSDPYNPPPLGREERHQGVDFGYYRRGSRLSIEGVRVRSILPGVVASVINNRLPYGNMIIIETPGESLPASLQGQLGLEAGLSLYHLYAHMQELPPFELGQAVMCGERLGQVGITGYNVVEYHLHLEIRIGPHGQQFAEMAFYDTRATQTEMDSYILWRTSGNFNHFDPMLLFSLYLDYTLSEGH